MLLEIHGQGDSRALMRPEIQCETLDAFAGTAGLRAEFAAALATARDLRERIGRQAEGERERKQRLEFLRFQFSEMKQLDLGEGELERLEQEHQVLSNLDAMRQQLAAALTAMQDGDANVSDQLAVAARATQQAAAIDVRLEDASDQMAQIEDLVQQFDQELINKKQEAEFADANQMDALRAEYEHKYARIKQDALDEIKKLRDDYKLEYEKMESLYASRLAENAAQLTVAIRCYIVLHSKIIPFDFLPRVFSSVFLPGI